jgi:hypothetical protein
MKVGDRVKLNLAGKRCHCELFNARGADKTGHWYKSLKKHRNAIGTVEEIYDRDCVIRWDKSLERHSYYQKHLTVIESV